MVKKSSSIQARINESPSTNTTSPNRQRQTYASDSEDLTGSYTSYSSSGEYSSVGNVLNQATSSDTGRERIFLKPTYPLKEGNDSQLGHGILSQVFKMQSLLEEYQTSLTALEIEKADNQQEINKFDKRLKAKSENEERYKEDIWNLELNNQELTQKLNELAQELSRSNLDCTRLARERSNLSQELDGLKAVQHSWEQKLKNADEVHEQETIVLKKSLHVNKIEKETLSKQIQNLVAQHAAVATKTSLRHIDSETNFSEIQDTFTSAMPSHVKNAVAGNTHSRHSRDIAMDALKISLDQAHRIIQTMQEKIDIERQERIEVNKLLREAQETIESFNTQSVYSHCKQLTHHRPNAAQGKSLSDELAGSADNFKTLLSRDILTFEIDQHEGSPKMHVELTYVDLPSLSNLDMRTSFCSSIKSEQDNDYNPDIKLAMKNNYGSLLTKPESYFYKSSRRELPEEKNISSSALFASTAVDSILNSKLELFTEVRKRNSNDDGSVTALTRTMIGDWMWKYTRNVVGSGISENRHRRFFWIHPYTQTLYWSSQEPGSITGHASTKSALVESFVLLDPPEKSKPPSILIKTPTRGLKIECVDMPSHEAWLKSLQFILANDDDIHHLPKLSKLNSVSKRHYQNRKKNRTQNDATTFPSDVLNNSTLIDLSNNSNSLLRHV